MVKREGGTVGVWAVCLARRRSQRAEGDEMAPGRRQPVGWG